MYYSFYLNECIVNRYFCNAQMKYQNFIKKVLVSFVFNCVRDFEMLD